MSSDPPATTEPTESSTSPELSGGPSEQLAKCKVELRGVAETLLITVAARAFDASNPKPILGDPYASGILEKLDYDFAKVHMLPSQRAGVALRARHFDRRTASFLAAHPRATVLHLGCGLDSRAQRVEWGGDDVRWIDVDLPEVAELRRQVLPTSFSGRDYKSVGASVTDEAWLEEIPADRPTVVVMEGLVSYLKEDDAKGLLRRLVERFTEGELLFECLNEYTLNAHRKASIKAVSDTGAEFQWFVEDPKLLEEIHPQLQMLEAIRFVEAPGVEEFPLLTRFTLYILSWLPKVRDSARFLRFRFGPTPSD